jgi:imidazolonepropionase-like amidohydrolase
MGALGCRSANVSVPSPQGHPDQHATLALLHGTLINPGARPILDATVVIGGTRIICAGREPDCHGPTGVKSIDLRGLYVGPGLIDAHVHYSQTGWVDGRPDAIDLRARYPYDSVAADLAAHPERFHRADLCSGVTSVFDVGGFPWTYEMSRRSQNANDAPRVVATGPLLATIEVDPQMMGQFDFMRDDSTVRAAVRAHRTSGAEALKVWYIEVPDSLQTHAKAMLISAGDEARKVGLRLVVHATELARAKEAVEVGAVVLVHDVFDSTVDPEFLTAAKRRGTIVIPTLTVLEGYADVTLGRSPKQRYPFDCVDPTTRQKLETVLPDTLRAAGKSFWGGPEAAKLLARLADNLRRMYQAGIPIAMGTDAGNPGTAHGPSVYREMEAMQQAGMPASAVFTSATVVAARAMALESEVGSVAPGKRADLVVFGANPTADIRNARQVRLVIRNGVLRSREDLLP